MKKTLREIMTISPTTVSENDTLLTLKRIYEQPHFHHHIPVTRSGKVVGMISLLDFMHAIGDATLDETHPNYQKSVKEIMSSHITSLNSQVSIDEALKIFLKNEIHAIPVTENDRMVGIVTSTDLLKHYSESVID